MITIELVGDRELAARLDAMPGRVHDGLARAVTRLGLELQRKVQAEKLTGQVLKVRTGSLRSSINTEVTDTPARITASVGSNIRYGRVHEYGVDHPWVIAAKRGKALRFEIGGRVFFRRSVTHPPLPERSFLRSALAEMAPQIDAGLRAAVAAAIGARA
jgi:phage gpG-like protein